MRDIFVTLIVFGSLPFILKRPYVGILMWAWISYMNPHRLTYGFAYTMPFAQVIAIFIVLAFLFNKDKQKIPVDGTVVVWALFLVWMSITTVFAIYPDYALVSYIKVMKIQLLTFFTIIFLTSLKKVEYLIWVIVLSIGYYSIKGGIFTLVTGGGFRVWGPPGTFIYENNSLALATLMVIPLMYYLYSVETKKWLKYGLGSAVFLSLVSALGSQSRGALLAAVAVLGFFWLKTKGKLISGIAILLVAGVGWQVMPQAWHDRMSTISNYQEDRSAMGRINAWTYSINIANDKLLGGGFDSWGKDTFSIYSPQADFVAVAHSIYFNVLADHGWIGLFLFLGILYASWRNLSTVIRLSEPDSRLNLLSRMLQVSFVAYLTGGAFLSLSYFDLPWHLIAITLLLKKELNTPQVVAVNQQQTTRQGL